jgi:phage shock protein E
MKQQGRRGLYLLIGTLVIAVAGFGVWAYFYAIGSPYRVSAETARAKLRSKQYDVVLDVRTQVERDTLGFYPNSVHIPSGDLETSITKLFPEKHTRFLLYCNTGQRARRATEIMKGLGYTDVEYILGGPGSLL